MSFLSLVLAVVLAHFFPFEARKILCRFQEWLFNHFETGHKRDAPLAWFVGILPALLLFILAFWVDKLAFWEILVFNVAVLWLALDFLPRRRLYINIISDFSGEHFESARQHLINWQALDGIKNEEIAHADKNKLAEETLNAGLVDSHRHFFAPLYFFLIFGAAGALFYRITESLAQKIEVFDESDSPFWRFCQKMYLCLDWLPSRLTLLGYAVMGNFEGAMAKANTVTKTTTLAQNAAFLSNVGKAALLFNQDEAAQNPSAVLQHGEALVDRIFGMWLFFISLLFLHEIAGRFFVV